MDWHPLSCCKVVWYLVGAQSTLSAPKGGRDLESILTPGRYNARGGKHQNMQIDLCLLFCSCTSTLLNFCNMSRFDACANAEPTL